MNMNEKLRIGDLFSGIGGWGQAIKSTYLKDRMELVWALDEDEKTCAVHKWNHPDATIHNMKIEDVDIDDLEPIDILVGSPPCVQFSSARQKTKKIPSDGLELVRKFLEIRDILRPKAWAFENVIPLLNHLPKLTSELGTYHTIKMTGTDYGMVQKRRRLIVSSHKQRIIQSSIPPLTTLGQILFMTTVPREEPEISNHTLHEVKEKDILTLFKKKMMKENAGTVMFPDRLDRPARTIVAQPSPVGREPIIILDTRFSPNKLRYLSPREMAMIQSFPMWYYLGKYSRTATVKMIGNAFPPQMAKVVLQNLYMDVR